MPTHTFIVEVETERDSGLHASRDDINDLLQEAIEEAAEGTDLSGLGANGDSEYSISSASVYAVDTNRKTGRDALAEYDDHVIQDLPGDAELRKENKRLRAQLKEANRLLNEVKDRNIQLQERMDAKMEAERTRIWYADPVARREDYKVYIPDGPHDVLFFQYGERWDDTYQFEFEADGDLVVRNQGYSAQMVIVPESGNQLRISRKERR